MTVASSAPPSSVGQYYINIYIISSETTGTIELQFDMKNPWDRKTTVCLNCPGHMAKRAAAPTYVYSLLKILDV